MNTEASSQKRNYTPWFIFSLMTILSISVIAFIAFNFSWYTNMLAGSPERLAAMEAERAEFEGKYPLGGTVIIGALGTQGTIVRYDGSYLIVLIPGSGSVSINPRAIRLDTVAPLIKESPKGATP